MFDCPGIEVEEFPATREVDKGVYRKDNTITKISQIFPAPFEVDRWIYLLMGQRTRSLSSFRPLSR